MRSRSVIAIVVFVAAGATACGSSSKGATGTTSAPANGSTGSPGAAPTTAKISGSGGGNFCDIARSDEAAFSGVNVATVSADDLKKEFENLGPALQAAEKAAPSELKADFQTFIDAFEPYLKALAAANYDFTKLDVSSVTKLSSAKVKAASDHIEQYFVQVCHLTPPAT